MVGVGHHECRRACTANAQPGRKRTMANRMELRPCASAMLHVAGSGWPSPHGTITHARNPDLLEARKTETGPEDCRPRRPVRAPNRRLGCEASRPSRVFEPTARFGRKASDPSRCWDRLAKSGLLALNPNLASSKPPPGLPAESGFRGEDKTYLVGRRLSQAGCGPTRPSRDV